MSDREKVVQALEICASREPGKYTCDKCPYETRVDGDGCEVNLMLDAMDLLKEQEAKQIVRKQCKKEYEDGSIDYFAEWYCPHCKLLILRGYDNPSIKFCYKCGKPILWEIPVKWKVEWE